MIVKVLDSIGRGITGICHMKFYHRIEDNSYLDNKQLFNECLKDNPFVAQKKFINIH